MNTRPLANNSNLPVVQQKAEGKRLTRVSRKVLGELQMQVPQQKQTNTVVFSGKENDVENLCKGQKVRRTRVAARRLNSVEQEIPMEVKQHAKEPEKRIFPLGVKDIDADDAHSPQLCSEYALEIFAYLKQSEGRGVIPADYLARCPTIDGNMRAELMDWLVEVQMQFKLLPETLFLSVKTIDRFLAVEGKTVHKSKLQLVGVAAMFLVSKIEEVYAPCAADFVYITDNTYTEAEIRQMELRIIRVLNFDLCQPIALHFLRRYSKVGNVDALQHSLAKYNLEACLIDYNLVSIPGSLLASSSLCLSLLLLGQSTSIDTVWTPTLQFYSGYSSEVVLDVVVKLATNMVRMNRSSKLQAVRNKYKSRKFMKVADLGELKGEKLIKLAGSK